MAYNRRIILLTLIYIITYVISNVQGNSVAPTTYCLSSYAGFNLLYTNDPYPPRNITYTTDSNILFSPYYTSENSTTIYYVCSGIGYTWVPSFDGASGTYGNYCTVTNSSLLYSILSSPFSFSTGGVGKDCWCALPSPPAGSYVTGLDILLYAKLHDSGTSYQQTFTYGCNATISFSSSPLRNGDLFWQNISFFAYSSSESSPPTQTTRNLFIAAIVLGVFVVISMCTFFGAWIRSVFCAKPQF